MTPVRTKPKTYKVVVGLGSCGIAAGGQKVRSALQDTIDRTHAPVELTETGCVGMCYREPLVDVIDPQGNLFTYGNVTPERIPRIVEEHFLGHDAGRGVVGPRANHGVAG